MRLVFANTVPVGLSVHARGQLSWLVTQGFDVVGVSGPGIGAEDVRTEEGIDLHELPMERNISLFRDLKALRRWWILLRRLRPDVIVYGSPKASLLASVASAAVRVPRRVYIAHGVRFEGSTGMERAILIAAERVTARLSHRVIAVSPSVRSVLVEANVAKLDKVVLVGYGSCNGVDVERFSPVSPAQRRSIRHSLGIDQDAFVLGFVGRLTASKGLDQLAGALENLERALPTESKIVLLVAGWQEDRDISVITSRVARTDVRYLGYVRHVEDVYRASDVVVLPTQREGMPTSVLEAAACGVPTVANRVTGAVDAVLDGESGYLVAEGDAESMAERLERLALDRDLTLRMGRNARRLAISRYRREAVWPALAQEYRGQLPRQRPPGGAA